MWKRYLCCLHKYIFWEVCCSRDGDTEEEFKEEMHIFKSSCHDVLCNNELCTRYIIAITRMYQAFLHWQQLDNPMTAVHYFPPQLRYNCMKSELTLTKF